MVILCVLLLASPLVIASKIAHYQYCYQSFPASAEESSLVQQQGSGDMNAVSVNAASAGDSSSLPDYLKYGCAFNSSNIRVQTDSSVPVDDPWAILNINLDNSAQTFVIYNAGNRHASQEDLHGKGCGINVDGEDVAFSWQSPYGNNAPNSATVVYATNLTAGPHTIKGRFFTNYQGGIVGIDTRQIAVFWFQDVTANYTKSTVKVATTSTTPVDDMQAILTLTLSESSVAFVVYNVGNKPNSVEGPKGITINIDAVDISSRQWQSPVGPNEADSVTIVYATTLEAGSHTVKGRFFSMDARQTVTIDERQLVVFCFPVDLITYWFKQSSTPVSTSSSTPVDDTEAILTGIVANDSDCLIMYTAGNLGSIENCWGKGTLINIDGADRSLATSWQSPYDFDYPDSETSLWYEQMAAGPHTIKGRFLTNFASNTVTISNRQLVLLAFHKPPAVHDIATTNVSLSNTKVHEGQTIDINATVTNEGTVSENFNVVAFFDDKVIQTRYNVALDAGMETTLAFSWNTSGFPGNHIISVETSIVPGENHTSDNIFVYGIAEVIAYVEAPIREGENAIIEGNMTIIEASVVKNILHFNTSGPSEAIGWINVTFPMINTTEIKVFIDEVELAPPPFPTITTNGTHYFVYFEFILNTHYITLQFAVTDIAITNVAATKNIIKQGFTVRIDVTTANKGDFDETFNITIYANSTEIGKQIVTLSNGSSSIVSFTWDTSGFIKGNHTITAVADQVLGETSAEDNTLSDIWIFVAMPGDINADGTVDIFDLVAIALHYNEDIPPSTPWPLPPEDINGDYSIDLFDLVIVALHFGEKA